MAEELIAKHDTAEASVPVTASAESAPASLDAANTENKGTHTRYYKRHAPSTDCMYSDETVDAAVEPSTAVDEDSIMASPTAEGKHVVQPKKNLNHITNNILLQHLMAILPRPHPPAKRSRGVSLVSPNTKARSSHPKSRCRLCALLSNLVNTGLCV